eukprot:TRINITY_DN9783_c0_g2_i2.p1 TRINITY_DN9783_c0_g2~~TRINITY_DN9783_c0_g2_i2.p1  ORF type:complete len:142 (-),score=16.44 TRINITY_DN9783_c0_g2_i2:16-441(-)
MTSVTVNNACLTEFSDFKLKKYRYLFFKISDDRHEIVLDKIGDSSRTYDDFLADLPDNEPRYVVYNFEYDAGYDGTNSKVLFFSWAPDTSKIKDKMIYAGTKDTFKKAFKGLEIESGGTDKSEVAYDVILERVQSRHRHPR